MKGDAQLTIVIGVHDTTDRLSAVFICTNQNEIDEAEHYAALYGPSWQFSVANNFREWINP